MSSTNNFFNEIITYTNYCNDLIKNHKLRNKNILGELAELAICDFYKLHRVKNNTKGHDLVKRKKRYQVKYRSLSNRNSYKLSIHQSHLRLFDVLIVLFHDKNNFYILKFSSNKIENSFRKVNDRYVLSISDKKLLKSKRMPSP